MSAHISLNFSCRFAEYPRLARVPHDGAITIVPQLLGLDSTTGRDDLRHHARARCGRNARVAGRRVSAEDARRSHP